MQISAALNLPVNNTQLARSVLQCARTSASPTVFTGKVKGFARLPDDLTERLYTKVRLVGSRRRQPASVKQTMVSSGPGGVLTTLSFASSFSLTVPLP